MLNLRQKIGLLFTLLWCSATSDPQHLVCKTVQDVFNEGGESGSSDRVRRHQGPPGKKGTPGSQGIQGIPGPPGSPATVDYDQIDDVIATKVELALTNIKSRMAEMEANITKMSAKGQNAATCEFLGGHYFRQKCYTIPHISSSRIMDYDAAVSECAKHGALLAEIHNRDQQNELRDFALTKMPAGTNYVCVRVGPKYQSSTSKLLYRSGKLIPIHQLQWSYSYPSGSEMYLTLEVRDGGGSSEGIFNYRRSYDTHGVLCERNM